MERRVSWRRWRFVLLLGFMLGALAPIAGRGPVQAQTAQAVSPNSYLVVTPTLLYSGQNIQVQGCGFQPNTNATASVADINGNTIVTLGPVIPVAPNGCLNQTTNVFVPATVAAGQTYLVHVQDGFGNSEFGLLPIGAPVLSVVPQSVTYNSGGMQVAVSGGGFSSATTLTFSLHPATNPGATVSGSTSSPSVTPSAFTNVPYVVPGTATAGAYFIYAQAGNLTTATLVLISGSNGLPAAGGISFSASPATSGQQETATICGFATGLTGVNLSLSSIPGGTLVFGPTLISNIASLGTSGCYGVTFIVPTLSSGSYQITISAGTASATSILQVNITLGSGVLSLSPASATVAQYVTASGCGYTSGENVSLVIYNSQQVVVSTVLANVPPASTSAGLGGSLCDSVTFVVPSLPSGVYSVRLIGAQSGVIDTGTLGVGVTAPVITLTPASVLAGGSVTISGVGFAAGTSVTVSGITGATTTATVAAAGSFTAVLSVPAGTAAGPYTLTAVDSSNLRATASLIVLAGTGAAIQPAPLSGTAGQVIRVNGYGFVQGEQVALFLSTTAQAPSAVSGTTQFATVGTNGQFSAIYTVPAVASGTYYLVAVGQSSRSTALSAFTVGGAAVPGVPTPGSVPFPALPTVPAHTPASLPSVPATATTRYFAEGYTGTAAVNGKVTFNQSLILYNSGHLASDITITYDVIDPTSNAHTSVVKHQTVAPGATDTRSVNLDVGNDRYVSTTVAASAGIVAQESISRVSSTGALLDSDSSLGTAAPQTTWYLAEGYTGASLQEYITVFNPSNSIAHLQLRYLPSSGTPPAPQSITVQAHTRATINVRSQYNSLVPKGSRNVAAQVTSDVPVVVDRAMYWGTGDGSAKFGYALSPAVAAAGRTQIVALPATSAGTQVFVTVLNPGTVGTQVSLQLIDRGGLTAKTSSVFVGGQQRYTFSLGSLVPAGVGSIAAAVVTGLSPIVAEAPVYVGGSPNIGAHPGTVLSPDQGRLIGSRVVAEQAAGVVQIYNPSIDSARVQVLLSTAAGRSTVYDATVIGHHSAQVSVPAGTTPRSVLVLASGAVTSAILTGGSSLGNPVGGGTLF